MSYPYDWHGWFSASLLQSIKLKKRSFDLWQEMAEIRQRHQGRAIGTFALTHESVRL